MKKNISINISGIIFHIEEDGYELLKNYLESISMYFASYEDSKEITDDIESRIAEIFLSKLSNSKQVITREDVTNVMTTMGSVEDFAAAEAVLGEEPVREEKAYQHESRSSASESASGNEEYSQSQESAEPKKLYRDTQRKVLGGVAAGIAHYLTVDPLLVRLALIILFFSDIFVSLGSIVCIAYIVLWIVVPGNNALHEDEKIKKFYRNPDDQVIGGVCGGVAAYFGIDGTLIRLVFVLSVLFFGTGLLIYIVLWIITPMAVTLTEKMRMKGEPVTLSNIESSIKKNFNVTGDGEESTVLKVLLFPFRLIAVVLNSLGRALGPLMVFIGEAARVIFGLLLFIVGIAFVFSLLIVGGAIMGVYTADTADIVSNLPLDIIQSDFPDWGLGFGYIVLLIPAVALLLAGIAVVARHSLINSAVGWTALGIWFFCLAGLSVTLFPYIADFQDESRYNTSDKFNIDNATAILTLSSYPENEYSKPNLSLRGFDSSYFELRKEFSAHGGNSGRAEENAQMIRYEVNQQDSVLLFPGSFKFVDDAKFRLQQLSMVLYIPYEHPFMMDRKLAHILDYSVLRGNGYDESDMQDNVFIYSRNGLECLTCTNRRDMDEELGRQQTAKPANDDEDKGSNTYAQDYDVDDFESVNVYGPFQVNVIQGEEFQVDVKGDENLVSKVETKVEDGTLKLKYDENVFRDNNSTIGLSIVMPNLESVELGGATNAEISGFDSPKFSVVLYGSSRANVAVDTDSLYQDLSGASRLTLTGKAVFSQIEMSGAAKLDALALSANRVSVKIGGAAQARVSASDELKVNSESAGRVWYRGRPTLEVNPGGERNVNRLDD